MGGAEVAGPDQCRPYFGSGPSQSPPAAAPGADRGETDRPDTVGQRRCRRSPSATTLLCRRRRSGADRTESAARLPGNDIQQTSQIGRPLTATDEPRKDQIFLSFRANYALV